MKISVIAIAVAAVASASAIAYFAADRAPLALATPMPMARIASHDTNVEVALLAAELATLRRELGARAESRSRAETSAPIPSLQVAEAPVLDPRSDAAALEQAERQFEEHTATVAATFSGEPRDPTFALNTSDSLRVALDSDELAKMPVQTIDCRTKTCRVEIGDDGSGVVPQVLPMLMVRMADSLPNVIAQRHEQPNGRATMVLYMSK
jgi:hypothetical protein